MITLPELQRLARKACPGALPCTAQLVIAWILHDPHHELPDLFGGLGARKDELLNSLAALVGNMDAAEATLLWAGSVDATLHNATGVDLLLRVCATPQHPVNAALCHVGMRLEQLEERLLDLREPPTE